MTPSRARTGPARTLGPDVVEKRMDSLCTTHGVRHLNVIRDNARAIAPLIGREKEFDALDAMISMLMQTREARPLLHRAKPALTGRLSTGLHWTRRQARRIPANASAIDHSKSRHIAGARAGRGFMEAYFSNFIEGTEFAIGEAVEIVFEGRIPENRPADGHDVLGTYLQLVELGQRSAIATDADTFIDEVQERHRNLMTQRPGIQPGVLKTKPIRPATRPLSIPTWSAEPCGKE